MRVNFCTHGDPQGQQVVVDVNSLSWKGEQSKILRFKIQLLR